MRLVVGLAIAAVGCGRFGFDDVPPTANADADIDAFDPMTGPWAQVFAKGATTCAIKDDGSAWCQGNNSENQLGTGPATFTAPPAQLPGTWRTLAIGRIASCGVQTNGTLWCWGGDSFGAVPDGTATSPVPMPKQIGTDTDWDFVVSADRHGCGHKQNNTLWCWGDNGENQFDPSVPAAQTPMLVRSNVRTMAAYQTLTNVVDMDGSLWISGRAWDGESGTGMGYALFATWTRVGTDSDWTSVAAGEHRTCATKATGTMWCSGMGIFGALGNDTENTSTTFVQVASGTTWVQATSGVDHVCGRQQDDSVWCWGASTRGQFGDLVRSTTPLRITEAKSVAAGDFHTCLVSLTGVLRCSGSNHAGQIKPGAATKSAPHASGGPYAKLVAYDRSTCGIDSAGNAQCWGANDAGNLGTGGVAWQQTPTALPGTGWDEIALGRSISLGIRGGALSWWGTEYETSTYVGEPTALTAFTDFIQVAAGDEHACALRAGGDLYCVGKNVDGQLGTGTTNGEGQPALVGGGYTLIAAGQKHTCGVKGGGLFCWGHNQFGAVGDNTTTSRESPTSVICADCAGKTVRKLSLGNGNAFALMTDDTMYSWGLGEYGQLGHGTAGGTLVGAQAGSARAWRDVDAGDSHVCAIDTTNAIWCWGHGDEGQLGDGTYTNAAPELRRVGTGTDWATLAIGAHHSCALEGDGSRYCWGANDTGVYGDGSSWFTSFIAIAPDM